MNMFMNTTLKLVPQPSQFSGIIQTILLDSSIRFCGDLLLAAIMLCTRKDVISKLKNDPKTNFVYGRYRGHFVCFTTVLAYIITEYLYPDWEIYAALLVNMISIWYNRSYDIDMFISLCAEVMWPTSSVLFLKEYGIIALFMYRTGRDIIGKNIFMCITQLVRDDNRLSSTIANDDNRQRKKTAVNDKNESEPKTSLDRVLRSHTRKQK